ncbi:MAG: diacylglycerol kinase family lipid kinase [Verrucomicrobia bacterium]|nr:diacylglycerol kinase family lipid kinase [Verrucomicrobiota bacterium]
MRGLVIFNPVARRARTRKPLRALKKAFPELEVSLTRSAGDAHNIARDAVVSGCDIIIAAGGDGTINEIVNGILDAPEGHKRPTLGIIPLGTANVFARELGLTQGADHAVSTIIKGYTKRIDLPIAEYHDADGNIKRRAFIQLAGAGLDAQAISMVNGKSKKRFGALAYIFAGSRAIMTGQPEIKIATDAESAIGPLVLIGNGRFYGGGFVVFPDSDISDGLMDVCVFSKVGFVRAALYALTFRLNLHFATRGLNRIKTRYLHLSSMEGCGFEVDGEFAGYLPVTVNVLPGLLNVITAGAPRA